MQGYSREPDRWPRQYRHLSCSTVILDRLLMVWMGVWWHIMCTLHRRQPYYELRGTSLTHNMPVARATGTCDRWRHWCVINRSVIRWMTELMRRERLESAQTTAAYRPNHIINARHNATKLSSFAAWIAPITLNVFGLSAISRCQFGSNSVANTHWSRPRSEYLYLC